MKTTSYKRQAGESGGQTPALDDLPPAQAREARRIMQTMPEGSGPTGIARERSRWWLFLMSVLIFVSLIGILVTVGSSLSTAIAVLAITLAYGVGLLPLIGAALLRRRDHREAVERAGDLRASGQP